MNSSSQLEPQLGINQRAVASSLEKETKVWKRGYRMVSHGVATTDNTVAQQHKRGHDGATCTEPQPGAPTSAAPPRPGTSTCRSITMAAAQPCHRNPRLGMGLHEPHRAGAHRIDAERTKQSRAAHRLRPRL
jgi:hypothetical protein